MSGMIARTICLAALLTDGFAARRAAAAQSRSGANEHSVATSLDSGNAVVQRYVQAIGGAANIARVRTRLTQGTMALGRGINGTWQETQQAPDLFVEHGRAHAWIGWSGEFGGGYDGGAAWQFAPGEQPHRLEGPLGELYVLQHRLDRDAHLAELYPTRSLLADRVLDGQRQQLVRMTTALGTSETWCFDAMTGLLARIEREEDRGKAKPVHVTMTFDDYRVVDGVRVPFRLGIDKGDRPIVITITSIVDNVPVDASAFDLPTGVRHGARFAPRRPTSLNHRASLTSSAAQNAAGRLRGTGARPVNEVFRVMVDSLKLHVLVRHHRPTGRGIGDEHSPILFVHGSSFPSALAAAFKFDGVSWMDGLADKGFDVWALDFIGYGGSDRYREMRDAPFAHPPVGRAPEAERQILAAVRFIIARTGSSRVSLIAHSWGTIPAGLMAGDSPTLIDRLVDFGPVAQREGQPDTTTRPAFAFVTEQEQRTRFNGYVPAGESPVLDPHQLESWERAYLATDSTSRTRSPASVEVPNGPSADVAAAWSGHLPYDPGRIVAPVLIIRGEWDVVTRDADARWLWNALSHAALRRDVKLSRATHVMHLESARRQLYAEVATFLAHDVWSAPNAGSQQACAGPTRRDARTVPHEHLNPVRIRCPD
jgi:pimeloyl-ACP methyl ester carboxylesterase